MNFVLEVDNWGDWFQEREFSSMELAKAYALENYPHNEWRITDKLTGSMEFSCTLESIAEQEINRIQNTEHWRLVYQRREQEREMQQHNRRLREVANRQRREQSRRNRLRGFGFVGNRPSVTRSVNVLFCDRCQKTTINWKKEGF